MFLTLLTLIAIKLVEFFLHPTKTAIRTATYAQSFLLFCIKDAPAIMTTTLTHAQNLLLPSVQDNPAITMATHAKYSLQLVVASVDNKLLKGSTETNNVFAITTMSFLQLPKDNSAFIQISVPNDFSAIKTSSFMQLYVPTMITSIPYPANMTAGLATSKSLFLLCDEDSSEIMTPILLFNYVKDVPAIMVATHANYTLQLIVMSI